MQKLRRTLIFFFLPCHQQKQETCFALILGLLLSRWLQKICSPLPSNYNTRKRK